MDIFSKDVDFAYASFVALTVMAVGAIHVGSHRSLRPAQTETVSVKDAYYIPFIGSAVLFSLYLVFKYCPKHILDLLITIYFTLAGVFGVASVLRPWLKKLPPISAFLIGVLVAAVYGYTKHWTLNNTVALAFAVAGIELLALDDFKVGCILLSGLFVYDIFWVFGTEVMVSVAKNFNGPIKLVIPNKIRSGKFEYGALGLGDIVVPGIFLALMLRFDASRKPESAPTYKKSYYYTCLGAYVIAFVLCCTCMTIYKAAQPALLYIVPLCLGSVTLRALFCGELKELCAYKEKVAPPPHPSVDPSKMTWKQSISKLWNEEVLGKPAPAVAPSATHEEPAKKTD